MSQELLFKAAPYVALAVALVGAAWRLLKVPDQETLAGQRRVARRLLTTSRTWQVGLTVILVGHLVGLLIPRQILFWNQHPVRLLALEATAFACACVTLVGLLVSLRAGWRRDPEHPASWLDAAGVTLVTVLLMSGMGMALLHRWASSWSMTTLVPYVRSILWLEPQSHWVAALPFLARLHVLSFFMLLAALPFTSLGSLLARSRPIHRSHEIAVGG